MSSGVAVAAEMRRAEESRKICRKERESGRPCHMFARLTAGREVFVCVGDVCVRARRGGLVIFSVFVVVVAYIIRYRIHTGCGKRIDSYTT